MFDNFILVVVFLEKTGKRSILTNVVIRRGREIVIVKPSCIKICYDLIFSISVSKLLLLDSFFCFYNNLGDLSVATFSCWNYVEFSCWNYVEYSNNSK